jgi:hypothetical protein
MTVKQYPAVLFPDTETRVVIFMRWTASDPTVADSPDSLETRKNLGHVHRRTLAVLSMAL